MIPSFVDADFAALLQHLMNPDYFRAIAVADFVVVVVLTIVVDVNGAGAYSWGHTPYSVSVVAAVGALQVLRFGIHCCSSCCHY